MNMATGKEKRRKKPPKPDNPAQSRRFLDAAKALGVDESGEAFRKAMKAVLKPKGKKRGTS
jgi:hypothetical protein